MYRGGTGNRVVSIFVFNKCQKTEVWVRKPFSQTLKNWVTLGSWRRVGTELSRWLRDLNAWRSAGAPSAVSEPLQNPSPNSKKFFQILFLKKDASIKNHGTEVASKQIKGLFIFVFYFLIFVFKMGLDWKSWDRCGSQRIKGWSPVGLKTIMT